jgi:hypothetical protein
MFKWLRLKTATLVELFSQVVGSLNPVSAEIHYQLLYYRKTSTKNSSSVAKNEHNISFENLNF